MDQHPGIQQHKHGTAQEMKPKGHSSFRPTKVFTLGESHMGPGKYFKILVENI
jgi:hypothetical protein